MRTTYQTENKVEYDPWFHKIASCKENSEYYITIKKKEAPEMLQPIAREPIQLFFMIVSLICDFSIHFTPNVFKATHNGSSN